jgi:hypothetical protein
MRVIFGLYMGSGMYFSHIDNVQGSDINQSDMGHDNDGTTSSGSTKFGDSDDIQQVTSCNFSVFVAHVVVQVVQRSVKCTTRMTFVMMHDDFCHDSLAQVLY